MADAGILRTPDDAFKGLPDFPYLPKYGMVHAAFAPGEVVGVGIPCGLRWGEGVV
jgi:hypothetical protein